MRVCGAYDKRGHCDVLAGMRMMRRSESEDSSVSSRKKNIEAEQRAPFCPDKGE